MHVLGKCFCHLLSTDIRNGVQGQTVVDLVVVVEVFPDGVHDQPKEIGILVH